MTASLNSFTCLFSGCWCDCGGGGGGGDGCRGSVCCESRQFVSSWQLRCWLIHCNRPPDGHRGIITALAPLTFDRFWIFLAPSLRIFLSAQRNKKDSWLVLFLYYTSKPINLDCKLWFSRKDLENDFIWASLILCTIWKLQHSSHELSVSIFYSKNHQPSELDKSQMSQTRYRNA